ncbi:MAG TPA: hypothetical protein EYQ00_09375 [Dehalococcoidia bacterium]|nr:hypothetical protein [Dehalococcoidia bacterium]
MTAFTKQNLIKEGKYLTYMPHGYNTPHADRKFVARFKVAGVGSFATCLRKNFTVEEYFARMEAGESPLPIAESKGYILPHIKKWMKKAGYPVTPAGKAAWWAAEMVKINERHSQRSA